MRGSRSSGRVCRRPRGGRGICGRGGPPTGGRPMIARAYRAVVDPGSDDQPGNGTHPGMLAPMLARAVLLAVMIGIAGGLAVRRARLLTRLVRLGRPVDRAGDVPTRVAREGTEVLGQRKLFQRPVPGLMHALIFWGFLVLLTTLL